MILREYWWPRIQQDVREYVEGCDTCQRTKPRRTPAATPLHPFDPPSRPWEVITTDLIGPLPESQGYNAILVIVDWLSKAIKLEATHLELTAEGFARILRDRVFRDHGLPRRIIHDRDPRFVAKYLKELFRLIGIDQNPSTAYHPQTDGQTERMNQSVEQFLRIFVNHHQDDWKEWLSIAEFSSNDRPHSATHETPFFVNAGQHPWKGIDSRRDFHNEAAGQFAERMKRVREDAAAALRQAAEQAKQSHDRHARDAREYAPGAKVYLEATNLKTDRPTKKLDDKRFGPFKVKRKVGHAAYELELPPNWPAIHPVFNESYLTPYRASRFASQQKPPPPPPIEVEGIPEYVVEQILDSRRRRGRLQYLVHWEGFPREDDSWEPAKNLEHSSDLIVQFHQDHPNRPSLTNTIRHIESIPSDPRLYDEQTNCPGKDFHRPLLDHTITDVVLPVVPPIMDDIIARSPVELWKSPPPSTVRRLWFYETHDTNALTFVARLDSSGNLLRLHQLTNPLTRTEFRKRYEFEVPTRPFVPPPWLLHDQSRHRILVW